MNKKFVQSRVDMYDIGNGLNLVNVILKNEEEKLPDEDLPAGG